MKWEELFCNSKNFIKVNWHYAYFTLGISSFRLSSFCSWYFYWPSDPAVIILWGLFHSSIYTFSFFFFCWETCSKHVVNMQTSMQLYLISLKVGVSMGFGSNSFGEMDLSFLKVLWPFTIETINPERIKQD